MGKLTFGVFLPFYAFQNAQAPTSIFTQIRDTALVCEQLGYHSVWIDDHLMYGKTPMLECWTTLSALASATTSIHLGTMVTSNGFRNPGLLAKMAATVDVISNGRLELGIGAGVQKEEHHAFGFAFDNSSVRIARLKESVEIIKQLWTEDRVSYQGSYNQIHGAVCEPKPIQKPHPPITIGGSGEKHTLKVTAQHANRFDFGYLPTLEHYKRKLAVLEQHCRHVGRDFGDIQKSCWPKGQIIVAESRKELNEKVDRLKPKSVSQSEFESYSFMGTAEEFRALLKPFIELGVSHFMLSFADLPQTSSLELVAKACERLSL